MFESIINKYLDIGHEKVCQCSKNHLSCLTPKEWGRCMVGIWEFYYEKRDIRKKNLHPATYPIALPTKCIKLFTHEGELVLDPFVGSGSTLVAAQDLNRNAVGFDLKKEYIDLSESRLAQQNFLNTSQQIAIHEDALNIPNYLKEATVKLVVTSPPFSRFLDKPRLNKSYRSDLRVNDYYKTVQQYSTNENDLGTMPPEGFNDAIANIFKGVLPLLKPKAHCVINVNDLWWKNKRIPTHVHIIEMLTEVGYELRNVLIWDKRNLVNNIGIFGWPSNFIKMGATFEYILDFWRPPE